jgi:hypothetical protein
MTARGNEQDPEARAARRIVEAAEELYAAGRAYGLDVDQVRQLHVPLDVRIDAWLWRTEQLLADQSWRHLDATLRAERSVAA